MVPPDVQEDGRSPLHTLWPMIEPFLERAVKYSGDTTTVQAELEGIMQKQKQLWVIVDDDKKITAAGVSSLHQFITGLFVANIDLFGGTDVAKWFELLTEQFEKWAKGEGCNEIRFFARKGWVKHLPDYQLAQYVMRKKL